MKDFVTLYELNKLVQNVIEGTLYQSFWVEAEIGSANENRGHLYLELVQKAEKGYGFTNAADGALIAKASAKCWANTWQQLKYSFMEVTGSTLRAGMKVLLNVKAQFHPAYGFSWIVNDIDPTFTLGDMARRRQEIIRQLKEEGVFDMQKQLELPLFCQRIAVISSATAAGYGDFSDQLQNNAYGFTFTTTLFQATMQGENIEPSIIDALNKINDRTDEFDCIVIIRGGGATSDLTGFDTLLLAEYVAQFPIPIITGIGHERDECILDMISFAKVKTPTAAAEFLISHLADLLNIIEDAGERIALMARQTMERETMRLTSIQARLPILSSLFLSNATARLERNEQRMANALQQRIMLEDHRLKLLEQRCKSLDPKLLLNRGYSMTIANGKIVKSKDDVKEGDTIETFLADGKITSKVWKR